MMTVRRTSWLVSAFLLVAARAWAEPVAYVAVLTDEQAWKILPPAEVGAGQPLPAWVRALAGSLPGTAAAMLELDYAQRAANPLPPRLRAELRWVAARANRCAYGEAYARADFVRAGGRGEDLDELPRRLGERLEAERLAVQFVRQLTVAAYAVTDEQVARLVQHYGERQVVAIVLVAAYANFQDRLLLALGVGVEPGGPLPPVRVRFRKPPSPSGDKTKDKSASGRQLSPPAKDPPAVPAKVDDPEWTAVPFASLQERMNRQREFRQARIAVPPWESVRDNLPADVPRPERPMRIRWSLLNYGYQPRLTAAWIKGLRAFQKETDLDTIYLESMFWVATRALQCFY